MAPPGCEQAKRMTPQEDGIALRSVVCWSARQQGGRMTCPEVSGRFSRVDHAAFAAWVL